MRYGVQGSAEGDRTVVMVSGDSSGGMYEISGLTHSTTYTIEVAAVNSAGTGSYSIAITAESDGKSYYQRGIFTTSFNFEHSWLARRIHASNYLTYTSQFLFSSYAKRFDHTLRSSSVPLMMTAECGRNVWHNLKIKTG